MSLFFAPEDHAANPPETWLVVKAGPRAWRLTTADGTTLDGFASKRDAEAARSSGWLVNAYRKEGRWYAGETPAGMRSWADCKAEQERIQVRHLAAGVQSSITCS